MSAAPTILRVDSGLEQCSQTRLLEGIRRGLLQPSVSLSAAAAAKLQRARAGQLLRSLPAELLYDSTGLALFDQITHLPEYYLTEAEASILARAGTDIARACVQDGAVLLELGAGSMRKTRLLLDAVERIGCQDVTFVALDLCEDSLGDALTALQGCCSSSRSSSIRLMGLVGTYDEGLQHIQDQLTQHSSDSQTQHRLGPRKAYTHAAAAAASPAGPEESDPEDSPTDSPGPGSHVLEEVVFRGGSLGVSSTGSGGSPEGSTDAPVAVTPAAADADAADGCAGSKAGLGRQQGGVEDGCMWSRPKVVLWLGSSIGNCDRHQAAEFLRQVKDKALNPGDFLLLGIDRRNSTETVSAAYNDTQGVTRSFILNGLAHCCRVLDAALSDETVSTPPPPGPAAAAAAEECSSSSPSLKPSDFEYFCLYNEDLGRHEAYCQAVVDTVIWLPPASISSAYVAGADGLVTDGNSLDLKEAAAGDSLAVGQEGEGSNGQQSSYGVSWTEVHIAAGELISVEFSYKFSAEEVQQLAAAAGLVCVRAWNDEQQRYGLHLLQCRG